MARTELPMTSGFYVNRSSVVSNQMCSNSYVHLNDNTALAKEVLFGTAGLHQVATASDLNIDANRGSHVMDGIPYFVQGEMLYKITRTVDTSENETFTPVPLGTVLGSGRVSMADNGTQLCIQVPSGNGYIYNKDTPSFSQITDTDFTANGAPQYVVYIDGYFLFTTNSKKFIISALNDGLSYNALDFGSAEADPDDIVAPVVLNNQLYIGGSETFEMFRNVGGAGFPFNRVEGGSLAYGVSSPFSLISSSGVFAFIGGGEHDDVSIYAFDGSSINVISSDAIDNILSKLSPTDLDNVFAWAYGQGGDRFIGWTANNITIVYEIKSGKWHERKSLYNVDGAAIQKRWRVNSIVKAYNRVLVGDQNDGRIGEMDLEFYDEYGSNIISEFSTMPFSNLGNSIRFPSLELTVESGVGNSEDENPMITMSRSVDGVIFKNPITRRLGKIGDYRHRAIWRRNGRAGRLEVFKFSCSAKVKKVFVKLEADVL
tara:strand:- start:5097 stop:6554 length:1458 start_codon:yes stop_codon:yes gene_type:complete